jgi:hypothetical protein
VGHYWIFALVGTGSRAKKASAGRSVTGKRKKKAGKGFLLLSSPFFSFLLLSYADECIASTAFPRSF